MTPFAKTTLLLAVAAAAAWAGWTLLREGLSPRAVVPGVIVVVGLLFVVLGGRLPRGFRPFRRR